MHSKLVWSNEGERTFVLILEPGEEAFKAITAFAADKSLSGASVTAIGAFEKATVGWFDLKKKSYKPIEIDEQCEALSLIGDIATGDDGKPSLHIHAVVGLSDRRPVRRHDARRPPA
jgi:predicted DNA-binding protein with PD1-like motif